MNLVRKAITVTYEIEQGVHKEENRHRRIVGFWLTPTGGGVYYSQYSVVNKQMKVSLVWIHKDI